jgi:glycine dehydrogenase subunit 2
LKDSDSSSNIVEKLIFELSSQGRRASTYPKCDTPERDLSEIFPADLLREDEIGMPSVTEGDLVRHFIALSVLNHHVDKGFYPLGSCTMKYNPKINENLSRLNGLSDLHPLQPESLSQGALALMHGLGEMLKEVSGFNAVTLQPAAGAQGEFTGLLVMRAYHEKRNDPRSKVIIPDTAHGTNPASVSLCGYETKTVKSNEEGTVDLKSLAEILDEDVAAVMLTVPNTLGKFERDILEISRIVHDVGALMYLDGANLNAFMGITSPSQMGFDAMHFNLHKTFSTPHGGGGPGSGPVGVVSELADFLPVPVIELEKDGTFKLNHDKENSIGRVHSYYGNFLVMVRAYTYLLMQGPGGLRSISENAIINANYVMRKLEKYYENPYPGICMHECVLTGEKHRKLGVRTLDIAKRLLDFGIHAPTVYFPIIVPEALMIEPTETESRESLDHFIEAMITIDSEVDKDPEILKGAPRCTPVRRLDEARAARELVLKWEDEDKK